MTQECIKMFRRILMQKQFGFPISGNFLKVVKKDLMDIGFADFYITTLIGEPGTGKTTLARACMVENGQELNFADKKAKIREELVERQYDYALIDDFASFNSFRSRDKEYQVLDEFGRASYAGKVSLLMITVESMALDKIIPSLRQRLIEVPVDDLLQNQKKRELVNWLIRHKKELTEIVNGFAKWYAANISKEYLLSELDEFRGIYCNEKPRRISMFFAYSITMRLLENYLVSTYGMKPIREVVEGNYKAIWKRENYQNLSREDVAKYILNRLLLEGAFDVVAPITHEICNTYCQGKCRMERNECIYSGYCFESGGTSEHYLDRELLIGTATNSAILIQEPEKIYNFPIYCNGKQPLLLIRTDSLVPMFNSALSDFCYKYGVRMYPFNEKKLHRILFDAGSCMFNYRGENEHKTFIFEYRDILLEKVSIMVIKLEPRQYEAILKSKKNIVTKSIYDERELTEIRKVLRDFLRTVNDEYGRKERSNINGYGCL